MQTRACYLKICTDDLTSTTPAYVSVNLRPISTSSTESRTEVLTSIQIESEQMVSEKCYDAPYVYGFDGPFLDNPNVSVEEQMKNGGLGLTFDVSVNKSALYVCYGGRVIDNRTNERYFKLPCRQYLSDYLSPSFKRPQSWPLCIDANFCVGPAKVVIGEVS
jgi:hypothetical protein